MLTPLMYLHHTVCVTNQNLKTVSCSQRKNFFEIRMFGANKFTVVSNARQSEVKIHIKNCIEILDLAGNFKSHRKSRW